MDLFGWDWEKIWQGLELVWIIGVNYIVVAFLVLKILLENKNPQKTYAYVLILFAAPVLGIIVYFTFGQNFRRNKMFSRKKITDKLSFQTLVAEKIVEGRIPEEKMPPCPKTFSKVVHLLKNMSHSMLSGDNDLKLLINGEEYFPEILQEIEKAKSHIHIEFYIFLDDELGNQFIEILKKKAEQGVEIRFIYDAVGSLGLSNKALDSMKASGIMAFPFLPIRFPLLGSKINYRNHRKILVVDGKVGFTGGINIDKKYDNRCENEVFWRDTGLKITGNGVWTLQQTFMFDWAFCSKTELEFQEKYFPKFPSIENPIPMQIAASGPDSDWASIMQAYFAAINQARKEIRISTPYFVPNESIRNSIKTASMGGIQVELMIPYDSDSKVVRMAMRSFFRGLLEAGVKIYQYKKGFIHAKTMTVDSSLSSVGTANMDMRSFDLNFEVNAFIYDPDFTGQLIRQFELDKKDCTLLSLEEVRKWNIFKKFTYSLARLFAPIL